MVCTIPVIPAVVTRLLLRLNSYSLKHMLRGIRYIPGLPHGLFIAWRVVFTDLLCILP